jgi:hypothetical protein
VAETPVSGTMKNNRLEMSYAYPRTIINPLPKYWRRALNAFFQPTRFSLLKVLDFGLVAANPEFWAVVCSVGLDVG